MARLAQSNASLPLQLAVLLFSGQLLIALGSPASSGTCTGSNAEGRDSVVGSSMLQASFNAKNQQDVVLKANSAQPAPSDLNATDTREVLAELNSTDATGSLSEQPRIPTQEEKDKIAARVLDELDRAPPWSVNLGLFLVFSLGIMSIALVVLACLQVITNQIKRMQGEYLDGLDNAPAQAVASKPHAKEAEEKKAKLKRSKTVDQVAGELTGVALWKRMNGDHVRLEILLDIANSEAPEARCKELVNNACKAFKIKLSKDAVAQASEGLLALAMAVKEAQKTHDASVNAKERFRRAGRKVLAMVRVSRAFNMPLDTNRAEEEEEAKAVNHVPKHEQHANQYSDGEKHIASGFQDTRLKKTGIQAYFASQRWLDHTAIAFVFLYSQSCAFVYAMYLKTRFPKMYDFMGPWLLVSRGEAMAIIVLTVMMVMLLSRGFITKLRPYMAWSNVLQTIADKHVLIHRYIGMMLVICAFMHILGHVKGSIPAIIGETDKSKINAAFTYGTKIRFNFNTWGEAAQCFPAITGYCLVLILALFWALSNERVRRWSFELFHYPHLILIYLWCATLIAHGWKQWLGVGVPLASLSVAPVVILFGLERIAHIRQGSDPAIRIANAVVRKTSVHLEIDTGSSGFAYNTGMYCMLKVPEISDFQWHPFTIASGGGNTKFEVLFAVAGDWTTQLKEKCDYAQLKGRPYPQICVRGGYGAPALGMSAHKHIIMVGGGVGATPFLSFLSNITSAANDEGVFSQFSGIESAVFYWLSREPDDFIWVNEYSAIIKASPKLKDKVSIRLCLTKSLDTKNQDKHEAAEIALFWSGLEVALSKFDSDQLASELGVPTQFGRPDWPKEFENHVKELKEKHPKIDGLKVAVFVCGKPVLVEALEEACTAVTDAKTKFRLFAEEF